MPFTPPGSYDSTKSVPVTHASIAPGGRRTVTADYALLYINGTSVGMVQRVSISEQRPVQAQYEIGNIYPVEFIPQPWSGRIQVGRLELFKNSIFTAFNYNNFSYGSSQYDNIGLTPYWPSDKQSNGKAVVTTLADIQWPLDMSIHIQNPATDHSITVKNYIECWITDYTTSFDSGAKVVAENVSFTFRNATIEEIQFSTQPDLQGLTNTAV